GAPVGRAKSRPPAEDPALLLPARPPPPPAPGPNPPGQPPGDGGLACPRQARQPQNETRLAVHDPMPLPLPRPDLGARRREAPARRRGEATPPIYEGAGPGGAAARRMARRRNEG